MTEQTKSPHVGEIALAAAFHDGDDVVGVPQIAAPAPVLLELLSGCVIELAFIFAQGFGVGAADRADAAVAQEDLLAKIAWVGAELPLVHTGVVAEGETPARHIFAAPAALAALSLDPSARFAAERAHTRSS